FILYYNYDYSVESINLGFTKIYDKGYEPRDVNDFLLDSDMILPLQTYAIECVKPYLNNPDKADFSMFDWGFSRYAEKYMVSGIVTDKDTQGQSVEIPFYLEVEASGESFEPLYLEMNSSVIFVSETVVEIPEPSPLPTETQPTVADKGDTITLVYGELGEYGKTVTIDGKDYIWFDVPSGKYLVKSKVPSCTIFVNKDEIKKNAEGYGETQIVIMLPITADDEPKEIYVGEDEHIFITISATVEITPVK
ncbi:MAG: hypothetical protein GX641_03900, partial [Mollicutes bacterium]|nr:hypothetical protein [Mollicutes bacterium]